MYLYFIQKQKALFYFIFFIKSVTNCFYNFAHLQYECRHFNITEEKDLCCAYLSTCLCKCLFQIITKYLNFSQVFFYSVKGTCSKSGICTNFASVARNFQKDTNILAHIGMLHSSSSIISYHTY